MMEKLNFKKQFLTINGMSEVLCIKMEWFEASNSDCLSTDGGGDSTGVWSDSGCGTAVFSS